MDEHRCQFREIEHTADLGVSKSPPLIFLRLFAASGEGLVCLIADPQNIDPPSRVVVSASGDGREELLHAWLCELLANSILTGLSAKLCLSSQHHGRSGGWNNRARRETWT